MQVPNQTRREFVKASAALAAAAAAGGLPATLVARTANVAGSDALRVGVIGCGGRGTGAAVNALAADSGTRIVALADVFADRINGARDHLGSDETRGAYGDRGVVASERCYTGFDAYKQLLDAGECDVVILASSPGFRPDHFEAAVHAGTHVFMEKPVAVDPTGIRRVIAASRLAEEKRLSVVAGTQRRHERCYLEWIERIRAGQIGKVLGARVYWNQGGLWVRKHEPAWTDMEWQIRNWLYFTWLSGDHIVEQHVHNLDVANWAMGGPPARCWATGGRQVRTQPEYGHIFDHFAVEYEYAGGGVVHSFCRQIDNCANRVEEAVVGTEGTSVTSSGGARIEGKAPWRFEGENHDPYTQEHTDLIAAIRAGKPINEGVRVAESTLTAIMGRMAAYTGKALTWEQAMNSKLDLRPKVLAFGDLPVPEVATPGRTALE